MQNTRHCLHETKSGERCKAKAQTGAEYCFFHDPALSEERTAARKAGGVSRTQKVVLPTTTPAMPLQTASDIVVLLGETINQVRLGELDLRVSNAIGYLSGILLSAMEKSSYEDRLAALEAAVASPPRNTSPLDEESAFNFVQQKLADSEHPVA